MCLYVLVCKTDYSADRDRRYDRLLASTHTISFHSDYRVSLREAARLYKSNQLSRATLLSPQSNNNVIAKL